MNVVLRSLLLLLLVVSIGFAPAACAEDGDGELRLEVFGAIGEQQLFVDFLLPNGNVDRSFKLGPDSVISGFDQSKLLGQILIEGDGDPFI